VAGRTRPERSRHPAVVPASRCQARSHGRSGPFRRRKPCYRAAFRATDSAMQRGADCLAGPGRGARHDDTARRHGWSLGGEQLLEALGVVARPCATELDPVVLPDVIGTRSTPPRASSSPSASSGRRERPRCFRRATLRPYSRRTSVTRWSRDPARPTTSTQFEGTGPDETDNSVGDARRDESPPAGVDRRSRLERRNGRTRGGVPSA
jgi:hypothetical protein